MTEDEYQKKLQEGRKRINEMDAIAKRNGYMPPNECPLRTHAAIVQRAVKSGLCGKQEDCFFDAIVLADQLCDRIEEQGL